MPTCPPPRHYTTATILSLAFKLGVDAPEDFTDWSYRVADSARIDQYLSLYEESSDADEQFVLGEILTQAVENLASTTDKALFADYWARLARIFSQAFELHADTVFYWSIFDKKTLTLEEDWTISPLMRALWYRHTPPNLLFVCTANLLRSPTAEEIYRKDPRFVVKSAGTADNAAQTLSTDLLEWADAIICMEKSHKKHIQKKFPETYAQKWVLCLDIPDEYERMQPTLVSLIQSRVEHLSHNGKLSGF